MRTFDEIYEISAQRKGGPDTLEKLISESQPIVDLTNKPDSYFLELMTRGIFQSGFSWKVIEAKWPGFIEAFKGFDVHACAFMDPEWFDALVKDTRIVRNAMKIKTVPENARFILNSTEQYGSFGKMIADWPNDDYIGLLAHMKKHGARLGAATGQYFLRFAGRDGFILSRDVVARLIAEGVVSKNPTSHKDMKAVQEAFNIWAEQSGRSFRDISRTLAMSTGDHFDN